MTDDLAYAGVAGQAAAIRAGDVSARELTGLLLARIEQHGGSLNAFTVVMAEEALAEAERRDSTAPQDRGPLHGVPVAIKEENDVEGRVTTFGTAANTRPAPADSEVVRRLRAAGAVVIGKTNMPEFGLFPFTESTAHGSTRNPWSAEHSPGGSSGGSAAAVAAGLVPAALGGDGGGSIRIPAACCGLFGLKPTRGRVSTSPHPHLWWGLGVLGPLTRSVMDCALVHDAIRGPAEGDMFRAGEPATSFTAAAAAEPPRLRIGWSTKPAALGVRPAPEVVKAVTDTAALLAQLGHHVEEIDPHYPDPTAAFVPQWFAGLRTEAFAMDDYGRLERRTRETVRLGAWARPGVTRWAMAQGERTAARANRVFEHVDVLLTPTIAGLPPRTGRLSGTGTVRAALRAMPMIAYCALWNVTGNPAASVPAGFTDDRLPLAVQLVGRRDDETTLLSLAAQLETARPWAGHTPLAP
ncbi:amidase [Streptomyces sp. NBC_00259]|uniref:amidase n=1 Tax=Streptomyces sp. NBC_00259 TaxID=2903643 RepID=UPI002E29FB5C|nr:amidase [Streptomyces sp. NBC_00259]